MNGFTDKTDDTLVEMTLLGSDSAFEELVTRYEKKVKGTAFKITKNIFSAEDASQDAFVSAWVKLDSLKNGNKFGSWVCSIARNCAVDMVRKFYNPATEISFEMLQNTDLADTCRSGGDIADFLERERSERLHEAVAALPEKIRETVTLYYFDEMSTEEIAKKLAVPVGTVKWRLSEGRKRLRKEYGVMETNEKTTFVEKVMQQVEKLKLWSLKNNKEGFEEEYREVLKNVEHLEESTEKEAALSEVLMRGYWWLEGEKNDQVFERIKKAAEKSLNEDVMEFIIHTEWERNKNENKIEYMENVQAPELKKKGFKYALGYLYFWLAHECCNRSFFEKGIDYYKKVTEILPKSSTYHAAALGAVYIEEKKLGEGKMPYLLETTGEELRYNNGKLYFMQQPGYSWGCLMLDAVFWSASLCDSLIFDEELKEGESIISSDEKMKITCKSKGTAVDTPSGRYENCVCYLYEGDRCGLKYCETYFCKGIGIVKQKTCCDARTDEWQLAKCTIKGGNEIVPFFEGNRWEYCLVTDRGIRFDIDSVYEITFVDAKKEQAIFAHHNYTENLGYNEDTWLGNIVKARFEYAKEDRPGELFDVSKALEAAEKLAHTKREKIHTSIAKNVMERIFATYPRFNPNYTEKGYRNFFGYFKVAAENGRITLDQCVDFCFEFKQNTPEETQMICHDYFYNDISSLIGIVWSDKWVEGYKETEEITVDGEKKQVFSFEVLPLETVKTPAGEFENCRHICADDRREGNWQRFYNGIRHLWFAPGIGIVKYSRTYWNDLSKEAVWELTSYKGKGEPDSYFPLKDGLFRHYEPLGLPNGWHSWVEYTFDEDESGFVIFKNTLGTCDR